jgi:hypothetical protein
MQASNQDENQKVMFEHQKELSLLLRGMMSQTNISVAATGFTGAETTEAGQTSSLSPQANHPSGSDVASDLSRAAGDGS